MARTPRRMLPGVLYLALVCALLMPGFAPARLALAAGPAALVKDIDTRLATYGPFGSLDGSWSSPVSTGGTTYFSAQLDSTGFELWKTDGTAAGTVLIKDILPGPEDSQPHGFININGTIYFTAGSASTYVRQLWKTDGTTIGTTLVKEFNAHISGFRLDSLTNVNGTLFFLADNGLGYGEHDLWKSDGTTNGTKLVKQLNMTASSLLNINGTLFFNSGDSGTGTELWKSDGTANGTTLVKDIVPGPAGSEPTQLTNRNGMLFFLAYDSSFRKLLWKSDGSDAGTVLVDPSGALPPASELINVNGTLYFSAFRPQEFGGSWSVWKSDGTAAGTSLLKDVEPGFAGSPASYRFTNVNGTLYFSGRNATTGSELWKSDGTTSGTLMIKDIKLGVADSSPSQPVSVNGIMFFSITHNYTAELWRTDGTAAGTVHIKDLATGAFNDYSAYLVNANGVLLFRASDSATGTELWKSDGTSTGTTLVKDIDPDAGTAFWNNPPEFTDVNGTLFFVADAGQGNRGLWKSDGSVAGTTLIKGFSYGQAVDSMPTNLTNVNGTLFFVADGGTTGRELWKSDGTATGTTLVKDIHPNTGDYARITELTNINGLLFFSADDGVHGQELWKSDGSAGGTTLVKDINPGQGYSQQKDITVLDGMIYFGASDGSHGMELWRSDGTAAGTTLVKDINPGITDGFAYGYVEIISANGMLFVVATNVDSGTELWRSDGTSTGTTLIKDINPGAGDSSPGSYSGRLPVTTLNGSLFFAADDGSHGRELWKTDGTSTGTTLVKDIVPGAATSYVYSLTVVNGRLLFNVESPIGDFGLWQTDGTTAGTSLVKASSSNGVNFDLVPIVPLGNTGKAIFSAYDDAHGVELWQTDGTAAGTQLLQDIAAGPIPSNPEQFTLVGAQMFFLADDHEHGKELWSLPLSAVVPPAPHVTIGGPTSGTMQASLSFSASVAPGNTALPITYLWQASDHADLTHTGGLTDSTSFSWNTPGTRTITVTASNSAGELGNDTHTITISPSQVTPANGGVVMFPSLTITFPPDAVTTPINLNYTPLSVPIHPLGGTLTTIHSFTLEARDLNGQPVTQFAQPYTLVISYTDEEVAALGIDEANLNLAFWNGSAWVNVLPCASCGVDTVNNRLTAILDHFTEFALFSGELPAVGDGNMRVYLPMARR